MQCCRKSLILRNQGEKEMIGKQDIVHFFDLEAEASAERWEAVMRLPLNDRIRRRKAIDSVFLDREFSGMSEDNYRLFRVSFSVNLSDFKEGECLVLHKEDTIAGIKCRLYGFDGDDRIVLEVYPSEVPSDIESFYDEPLVLDKDKVDLRSNVYRPFVATLPDSEYFWNNLILNSGKLPEFENADGCERQLDETIVDFGLSLLSKQREAILKSMSAKDYYLIQGPPGTGKSFVLGMIMFEEMYYHRHNVIVIGPNHLAINNAMEQLLKLHPASCGNMLKVGQSYNALTLSMDSDGMEVGIRNFLRYSHRLNNLFEDNGENWLVGLTPHSLYTSRARGLECDTLIIDEAGQMTIPLALMGMIKARKVIFSGDHKQLPPIVSAEGVSDDMCKSAFQMLISEGNCTMLDTSFRMCGPICDFVSELFYDGELKAIRRDASDRIICGDPLYSFDAPIVLKEIDDEGEQASEKEAAFIADTIAGFLAHGLPASDIAVLSPFRAQAAAVRRAIRHNPAISEVDRDQITSDTIDKMQGQEREVIIYSLTSGNIDYMKEMADFLYNPNKMNVAFSRAKSKLIIVGSLSKLARLDLPDYPHIAKMLTYSLCRIH